MLVAPSLAASLVWTGGVAGVWQNGAAGWLNGGSPANWNNATPDDAVFGGLGTGTVTVDAGGVTAGTVSVTQGVYTVAGSGVLTLSGGAWLVGPAVTTTVSAALGGSAGLAKTGSGELSLSGTNKNYTGLTSISGGVIRITATGSGSLGTTATNGVSLNGGALHALFAANVNVSNFIAVGASGGELRNLGNDSQRWQMIANRITGSGTLTLSFGGNNTRFTMASSQTGFTGRWIVDSGGNQNRFVDLSNSGAFGGSAGDDAITFQNSGAVLFRNNVNLGSTTQGITLGSGQTKIEIAGTSTGTVAGKISGPATNSVQFYLGNASSAMLLANTNNNWAGETTLNAAAGFGTLRLGAAGVVPDTGGVVHVTSAARLDLNGFTERIGGLGGAGRIDNMLAGSSATLIVGANNGSTNFTGSMTNSGAGATLNIAKVGSGTWTLQSTNLYYGGTLSISGGVVVLTTTTNGSLGATTTNAVVINGAGLHGSFSNTAFFFNPVVIGAAGAELRNLGDDTQRWLFYPPVGGLTGSGIVTMSFGSAVTRFIVTNNQPSFTGKFVINSAGNVDKLVDVYHGGAFGGGTGDDVLTLVSNGSVILRQNVSLGGPGQGITLGSGTSFIEGAGNATSVIAGKLSGSVSNGLTLYLENAGTVLIVSNTANSWLGSTTLANTGTLRIGASGVIPNAGNSWTLQPAVTIDLNGQSETFGGITGSGAIDNRLPSTSAMIGIGANNASTTFSGTFSNSGSSASLSVAKVGSGTLTLSSSAHAHSGSTIVSSGVLLVTGTLPAAGLAEVAAGTLAANSSIGNLRVRGGRISPNNTGIGNIAAASVNFTGGTYRVDINAASGTPGVNWDLITVAGGTGSVTNDTAAANPFKIELVQSSSTLTGFDGLSPLSWQIVDAGTQTGFASNKFTVETALFNPPQKNYGSFAVRSSGGDLFLDFNPYTNEVDLGVTLVASTNFALSGNPVSYTITITNNSASVAGLFAVTSSITANLQFTGTNSPGGVTNGVNLVWQLGGLAGGASTTLVLNAMPIYTGSTQELANTINVSVSPRFGDPVAGNNTASAGLNSVGIPLLTDLALLLLAGVIAWLVWRRHLQPANAR
ncbi:MAG TPA: autotransporter-associated beta strand repeat-containing protein [Kiritimatiellia bacterium]|nr:autotransporter-associated beta strand repeat-containing protein [Kiritimatiellia bacterium]HMP32780.1 autotransporter-associated beta strand repeat-containing protein [Kiritimatiellia bacterium]